MQKKYHSKNDNSNKHNLKIKLETTNKHTPKKENTKKEHQKNNNSNEITIKLNNHDSDSPIEPKIKSKEIKQKKQISLPLKIGIGFVILLLILFAAFIQFFCLTNDETYTDQATGNITRQIEIETKKEISLENYLDIKNKTQLNLIAYLTTENKLIKDDIYSVEKFITDDKNNKIKIYLGLTTRFDDYFLKNGTTTLVFNITGTMHTFFNNKKELVLEIKDMKPIKMQTTTLYQNITRTELIEINKTRKADINFTLGLERLKNMFQ